MYFSDSTVLCLQVIQEVLCWSRNPMEVRRLCARKEEIYAKLIGNHKPPVVPGVPMFLDTLVKHNVSRSPSLPPRRMHVQCGFSRMICGMLDVQCLLYALSCSMHPTSCIATIHQRDLMQHVR